MPSGLFKKLSIRIVISFSFLEYSKAAAGASYPLFVQTKKKRNSAPDVQPILYQTKVLEFGSSEKTEFDRENKQCIF